MNIFKPKFVRVLIFQKILAVEVTEKILHKGKTRRTCWGL